MIKVYTVEQLNEAAEKMATITREVKVQRIARKSENRDRRRFSARLKTRPNTPERELTDHLFIQSQALTVRLWDLEGPDPMASYVGATIHKDGNDE